MIVEAFRPTQAAVVPAATRASPQPGTAVSEHLTFRLGGEEYGVDILRVQEIRGYTEPTRIANAPKFLKGVVNLRGTIVPIVDLRVKFGLSDIRYDGFTVTVVLNIGHRVIGAVVDSVSDVLQLSGEQVKAAPSFHSAAINAAHITGIATLKQGDDQRMLILLDIAKLLTSADIGLVDDACH